MDYSKIIKRSWEITWKNKWLWVTGLVLATFSGGGYGSSSSTNFNKDIQPDEIKDNALNVLGVATDYVGNWFSNISVQDWIFLGLILLLSAIFGILIVWVLKSWAKGALIIGFEDADNGKKVNLKSISPFGIANIKKLIIYDLISSGMSLLIVVAMFLIIGIGYLISTLLGTIGTVLLVLFGIFAFLFFIFVIMIFIMISIYAERLIIIKGLTPWEAWKIGFSLSKSNFFSTLVMGIINSIIGFITGLLGIIVLLLVFAIPGFLLIYPIFRDGFKIPSLPQILAIVSFVILFFSMNLILRAVFTVFSYGNWNLFFKEVLNSQTEVKNE